jgi:RHS repeat-associated protein
VGSALDYNGNTSTKTDSNGITNYSWDFENRLTSVTLPGSGGTVYFKYDPFGRRVYKSSSSATSIYAYDGDNLIEEANAVGSVIARYAQTQHVDEPLAMLRAGTTSYYQTDGLGSISSLSSTAGSLAQTYTFDSFGNQTASSGSLTNPFRYTGRELDSETTLYYMRARYFDPATGRFLSEDPLGFRASENFYVYVENDPADRIDPSGLDPNWGPIVWWWKLFGPKPCPKESPCSVSVSCLPTHGTSFTHCTVTAFDGSGYTNYDGMPSGGVYWGKLIVAQSPPGKGTPPGPNTFFSKNVPCACAQQAADNVNKGDYRYNFVLQNSNTAAQMMLNNCGASPSFPPSAWGARPWK